MLKPDSGFFKRLFNPRAMSAHSRGIRRALGRTAGSVSGSAGKLFGAKRSKQVSGLAPKSPRASSVASNNPARHRNKEAY